MHELGITESILNRAREAAEAAGGVRVSAVHLLITPAADFTRDSIEMYFEMLTADEEMFRGAGLRWEERPAAATCLSCGRDFTASQAHPSCPACGGRQVRYDPQAPMIQLIGIDVEEPDEA